LTEIDTRSKNAPKRAVRSGFAGTPGHRFHPSEAFRVDFLWRAHKVIAEADGLGKYSDRSDAVKQLERDRRLRDAGFRVVHFTWKELFGTPELVLRRIRAAIAATTPYLAGQRSVACDS